MARVHTSAAIKVLKAMMQDKKAPRSVRVAAAKEILDRGWGRPLQVQVGAMAVSPLTNFAEEDTLGRDLERARRLAFVFTSGMRAQEKLVSESANVVPLPKKQDGSNAA